MEKFLIIDGTGLIFRAFYSLPKMNAPDGTPTNAVYGLLNMIKKVVAEEQPAHLACVFDAGAKTFRNDMYVEYKAHRPEPPDDLVPQFELSHEVIAGLGVPTYSQVGVEADDIIASLAKQAKERSIEVVILTSDHDLLQLLDDRVSVKLLKRGITETETMTPESFETKYGFSPLAWVDFKAIRGDPSDNIPGVPGVGEKTAQTLLLRYGSVAELFSHLDEIKPDRVRESLRQNRENAELFRELVKLKEDIPLHFDYDHSSQPDFKRDSFLAIAERLNLRSYLR